MGAQTMEAPSAHDRFDGVSPAIAQRSDGVSVDAGAIRCGGGDTLGDMAWGGHRNIISGAAILPPRAEAVPLWRDARVDQQAANHGDYGDAPVAERAERFAEPAAHPIPLRRIAGYPESHRILRVGLSESVVSLSFRVRPEA